MLFFAWGHFFSLCRVKITPAYSIDNLRLHKRTQWGFVWFIQPPFPLGVIKKSELSFFRTLCSRFYSSSRVFLSFVKRKINKFLLGQGNRAATKKLLNIFPDLINRLPAGFTLDGRASPRATMSSWGRETEGTCPMHKGRGFCVNKPLHNEMSWL